MRDKRQWGSSRCGGPGGFLKEGDLERRPVGKSYSQSENSEQDTSKQRQAVEVGLSFAQIGNRATGGECEKWELA